MMSGNKYSELMTANQRGQLVMILNRFLIPREKQLKDLVSPRTGSKQGRTTSTSNPNKLNSPQHLKYRKYDLWSDLHCRVQTVHY